MANLCGDKDIIIDEWVFITDGNFTVPKDGLYGITMIGGGSASANSTGTYRDGHASGISTYSIFLTKDDVIPYTIGTGGVAGGTNDGSASIFNNILSPYGKYDTQDPSISIGTLGDGGLGDRQVYTTFWENRSGTPSTLNPNFPFIINSTEIIKQNANPQSRGGSGFDIRNGTSDLIGNLNSSVILGATNAQVAVANTGSGGAAVSNTTYRNGSDGIIVVSQLG